jgi:hypothetical protein
MIRCRWGPWSQLSLTQKRTRIFSGLPHRDQIPAMGLWIPMFLTAAPSERKQNTCRHTRVDPPLESFIAELGLQGTTASGTGREPIGASCCVLRLSGGPRWAAGLRNAVQARSDRALFFPLGCGWAVQPVQIDETPLAESGGSPRYAPHVFSSAGFCFSWAQGCSFETPSEVMEIRHLAGGLPRQLAK